jgi:hypothetical protein
MAREIKNPASSAGRVRPLPGPLCESGLSDGIARFSTAFYPVFVTNLTSSTVDEKADPVRQTKPQRIRGPPTSEEYTRLPIFVKRSRIIFAAFNVEFTVRCGK